MWADHFKAERARWILWLPLIFAGGVGIYFRLPTEPALELSLTMGVIGLVSVLAAFRIERFFFLLMFTGLIALGFVAGAMRTHFVQSPVLPYSLWQAEVVGQVLVQDKNPGGFRLTLEVLSLSDVMERHRPHRINVTFRGKNMKAPEVGDVIKAKVSLKPPPGPAQPYGYDFARDLYFQKIGANGFAFGPPVLVHHDSERSKFRTQIEQLRVKVRDQIYEILPGPVGGVAAALLMGDRGAVPEPIMDEIRAAGLAHLISISGLHMTLVVGTFFFALRFVLALVPPLVLSYPIKKWVAFVSIFVALFYLLLSGGTVPTLRAFIMVAIVLMAVIFDRTAISLRLIAFSALIILVFQPEALLGPSFQMSFAAVTALVAIYEKWAEDFTKLWREASWLKKPVIYLSLAALTTLIASIATAPFSMYHFGQLPGLGVVANLIAVPLASIWIMPLGLLAMVLMQFDLHIYPLIGMGWGIEVILAVCHEVAAYPNALVKVPGFAVDFLLVAAAGLCWLCLWSQRWRWWGVGPLLVAPFLGMLATPKPVVLIDGAGKLLGIWTEPEGLALSQPKGRSLLKQQWLNLYGQEQPVPLYDPAFCRWDDCLLTLTIGKVALVQRGFDGKSYCEQADLLIILDPPPKKCRARLIHRFDLWRFGAHAVYEEGEGYRIVTAKQVRGDRPWAPTVKPRPKEL